MRSSQPSSHYHSLKTEIENNKLRANKFYGRARAGHEVVHAKIHKNPNHSTMLWWTRHNAYCFMSRVNIMKKLLTFYFRFFSAVTVTATQAQPPRIVSSIAKTMATLHMARPTSPYASSSSDTDANAPTGTALRRLYFKTAKTSKMSNSAAPSAKNSSSVPKVIVMNSSCNSTINTSTESASTHLTNITTTTDTETCDSLDLGLYLFKLKLISHEKHKRHINAIWLSELSIHLSFIIYAGDGDITEQHEPLLSESQDDSLTLSGQPDSITMADEKNASIINVSDDLDESITPLLGDDNGQNEVMN